MSNLVDIEDLGELDPGDLKAVFSQVEPECLIVALVGCSAGVRQQLLTKLSNAQASALEARVSAHGPVSFEAVHSAQRDLIETLCRLSRSGQVAFDDPEDMLDMVA